MAYTELMRGGLVRKSNAHDTAEVLTAAVGVYGGYLVTKRMVLKRFLFYVTADIAASTTAPKVVVKRWPAYNSSVGEVTCASLTIPTGTAAGKVVYKDLAPVEFFPGDELCFEHTVQTGDGTAAGAGFYDVIMDLEPEVPANESDMIASA